jgi:hypothetical protein
MDELRLHDRITRLERHNRRFRNLLGAAALLGSAAVLVGAADRREPEDVRFRVVYASKFALQDPRTDTLRAELSHQTMEGGWAGLTLWNLEGKPRAELKLWEDGSVRLNLVDSGRRDRVAITMVANGTPSLMLDGKAVR